MNALNTDLLTISTTTADNWDTRVQITVPATEIDKLFKDAEKVYMARAKVPGFRPGKVPAGLVRKRFKKELDEEVKRQVISNSLPVAIEKESLKPLQMPRLDTDSVTELGRGLDFSFAARFDVHPSFELAEPASLELYDLEEPITDEEIDGLIDKLRENSRNYEKTEDGTAAAGDMLKVTYSGTFDFGDEEVPATAERLIAAEDTWALLSDPEILPGIIEGLDGVKPGDKRTLAVTFGEDFHEPFLANRSGDYEFDILEVHKSVLPEVTEEFVARFGAESIEQFRKMVEDRIAGDRRQQFMQVWRSQVEQWLINQATFAMPELTLKGETDNLLPQIYREKIMQELQDKHGDHEHDHDHEHDENCGCGHDHDHDHDAEIAAEAAKADADEDTDADDAADAAEETPDAMQQRILEESRTTAAEAADYRLKLRIVRDAWAEAQGIEPTQEEVQQEFYQFMQRNQLSQEDLEQRYDVERLQGALTEEVVTRKLVESLIDKATKVPAPEPAADAEGEEAAEGAAAPA